MDKDYKKELAEIDAQIEKMNRRLEKKDRGREFRETIAEMQKACEEATPQEQMQALRETEGSVNAQGLSVKEILDQVNAAQDLFRKNR